MLDTPKSNPSKDPSQRSNGARDCVGSSMTDLTKERNASIVKVDPVPSFDRNNHVGQVNGSSLPL
jgi:hypothetical protein